MNKHKNLIRDFSFFILYISCIPYLIREFYQKNKITIISFHNIESIKAKKILSFLVKKYNIIDLRKYVDFLNGNYNKNFKIPPKSLIITIDDGLKENYNFIDIVEELKIPITLFVTTGIIGTKQGFWWNHNKTKFSTEELKNIDDDERIAQLKKFGFEQANKQKQRESLSFDEIKNMLKIIDLQSHSVSHPILPNCNSKKSKYEIFQSKKDLELKLDIDVFAFAYPNGNYSTRETKYVKSAGYSCALNTDNGYNSRKSNPFELNRISAGLGSSFFETVVKSSGLWYKLKNLLLR